MTPEALVALTLAGACLILLFWRTLLECWSSVQSSAAWD